MLRLKTGVKVTRHPWVVEFQRKIGRLMRLLEKIEEKIEQRDCEFIKVTCGLLSLKVIL